MVQIHFTDRVRLGFEIFELFEKNEVDKIAMEVSSPGVMAIRFRYDSNEQLQQLISDLCHLEGVLSVTTKQHMPFEDREYELRTILNSVREGMIAVNHEGIITHINQGACNLFQCSQSQVTGTDVERLFQSCPEVMDTLQYGRSISLCDGCLVKKNRSIRFYVSGSPILNQSNQVIGAVFTIQDDKQIRDMISTIDRNRKHITFTDIVYQSDQMQNVVELARLVAKSKSTILLRGESGTGKELFAHAIHMDSERKDKPFVTVNCASLPDSLLESELFGYEEGAFTGASKGGKKGIFEQADEGTLFLDEIGEISPAVQVKLLRVLQEGVIRRVGGGKDIQVDVRLIAATHRDLEGMIAGGVFREDLYYRLNVIPLVIPPLRERVEDIPLLAAYLIQKIARKLRKPILHFTSDSFELLMSEKWPGNVRQLENVIERIMNVVTETSAITPEVITRWTGLTQSKTARVDGDNYLQIAIPLFKTPMSLKEIVADVEKTVVAHVLQQHPSSRKAAHVLGVSNTTILNKVHTYGIESDS